MPKLIRKLVSKINGKIARRLTSSRSNIEVPICITIEPDRNTGSLLMKKEHLSIRGETKDLSSTGIAFMVDSIRIKEHYLVGEGRVLKAELDLPSGKVKMEIVGQRYEQVGEHLSVSKYLIGATIINMTQLERDVYEEFIRYGNKGSKSRTLGLEVPNG